MLHRHVHLSDSECYTRRHETVFYTCAQKQIARAHEFLLDGADVKVMTSFIENYVYFNSLLDVLTPCSKVHSVFVVKHREQNLSTFI